MSCLWLPLWPPCPSWAAVGETLGSPSGKYLPSSTLQETFAGPRWRVVHYMNVPQNVYPLDWWAWGCYWFLAVIKKLSWALLCRYTHATLCAIGGCVLCGGVAESWIVSVRSCQEVMPERRLVVVTLSHRPQQMNLPSFHMLADNHYL